MLECFFLVRNVETHNYAYFLFLIHYLLFFALFSALTIYGARHTRATFLVTEGIPLDVIAKVLGHSVEELTRTYRHLLAETRDIGFERIKEL